MINMEKENSRRPDFFRKGWFDLNGMWEFAFDDEKKGMAEGWYQQHDYDQQILVPFCYQSAKSKIQNVEKHPYLWYHRRFSIPEEMEKKRIWLHFGAVDYQAQVWVNGEFAGCHEGGHTSFSFEITPFVKQKQETEITVYVVDTYDILQPRGKQHWNVKTDRCWYTATSGIWQDVWLEGTAGSRMEQVLMVPDIDLRQVEVKMDFSDEMKEGSIEWELSMENSLLKKGSFSFSGNRTRFCINIEAADPIDNDIKLWSPQAPSLYDLKLVLKSEKKEQDQVETYFGMRKIEVKGNKILLNHKPLYQKLILDQGYYKDGLLTAPDPSCFKEDIELIKKMGFNGVRMHQKIESPVFLYYADRLGLLVWEEMPSNYEFSEKGMLAIQKEYTEMILRDYNHPSIITWVPYNESWGVRDILWNTRQQNFVVSLYHLTKALDPTRLVSSNDGWEAVTGDLTGIHDYEPEGKSFYKIYENKDKILKWTTTGKMCYAEHFSQHDEPILISEFGGIAFEDGNKEHWGYNGKVKHEEDFLERFQNLLLAIDCLDYVCGYCYTQFTDVEQETNGLLLADRSPKISLDKVNEMNRAVGESS